MTSNLAVRAPKGQDKNRQRSPIVRNLPPEEVEAYDEAKKAAARGLAQGFSARQVSKALAGRIVPLSPHTDPEKLAEAAYRKIRLWMRRDQAFRDLIFQEAVVSLDLKTPLILGGVAKAAQRGRVDAARLALEITGRHTSHEAPITNVQVVLNNVARPTSNAGIIEGEVEEES